MKTRIITAIVGILVLIGVLFTFDTLVFNFVIAAITLIAIHEVFKALGFGRKEWPMYAVFVPYTLLIMLSSYQVWRRLVMPASFLMVLFFGIYLVVRNAQVDFAKASGLVMFSGIVIFCFYSFIRLKELLPVETYGYDAMFFILLILCFAWGGDTCAYFAGRAFGKHKLCPVVSPKKTVEGAIGGVLGTMVFGVIATVIYSIAANRMEAFTRTNIGVSHLIDKHYGDNPQKFVDGLKRIGIDRPLHLQIAGEGKPNIRGPKERYFAKTTLPWMSIGYETQVPPLNILTFYNAIANNGTMVRPKFVKAAVKDGEVVRDFPTEVINPKICSDNTLTQIREILRKVVAEGLAKPAGSKQFAVAGKTGTAQISQGAAGYKAGRVNYLVSFCGYFPAEAPKYSCIVSIQKPGLPASGGLMAGSVFSKIAERVYAKNLRFDIRSAIDSTTNVIPAVKAGEMNEALCVLNTLDVPVQKQFEVENKRELWGHSQAAPSAVILQNQKVSDGIVPSVVGMGAKDAVYLLESKGLRVRLNGIGKVRNQSIAGGSRLIKGQTIALTLR